MGWSIGYDSNWRRDVGYGVPATCDHPDCPEVIDRGITYTCGGEPLGGEHGCGLHFCERHLAGQHSLCERCRGKGEPFVPKLDQAAWCLHKLTDASWKPWRDEHPAEAERLRATLSAGPIAAPTEVEARAEFHRQHAGRNLGQHRLRGTYTSAPIAALWNQHLRTIKWMVTPTENITDAAYTKEPSE